MKEFVPSNIWVVNEDEFEQFTYTCGKVIYIVEEPEPKYLNHPSIITAGSLLPPIEAIQLELDGNIDAANALYIQYLNSAEADPYVSIILAAAIKCVPIGIMFGKDEMNQKFPLMLVNYLFNKFGIILGVLNKVNPSIVYQALPYDLAKLYMMNIIDYAAFMMAHPDDLPIHPSVLSKLAMENYPLVKYPSESSYQEYFGNAIKAMKKYNKFLIDPIDKLGLV